MKLTKKTKDEITQFLQTYWDTYMRGDISKWQSFLPEDYKNIGTNQEEIWNNKNEILDYTNSVLDQMAGKAEMRNKKVQIIPYAPYVMTHELGDLFIKTEEGWTFYAPLRLSSLIQRKDDRWMVLHQHGSFPDSKTQKGEAFAVDALKAENIKLQKAVQQRTAELEQKNRKLEIESALERIRAQVTSMQESSDLFNIVVAMRKAFISLGHDADYFWHMKWTKDNYEMSMTSEDGSRVGMIITVPKFVHNNMKSLAAWEKSKKPSFVLALNADEAWDYIDNMNTHGQYQQADPNAPTQEDIEHIGGLTFIIARTTHGEIGFSLAGKVENPPKASIDTLVRFAQVFDLAYKRFKDLQKAEAQIRETQIELALEKVRSRTMAMQHSDELQETSFLLDQQVRALGIQTWGCAFNIYGEKDSTEWFGNEASVLPTYTVPRKGIFKEYYQKGQKGESFFTKEFSGNACVAHYEYMSSLPVIGDVLKNLKKSNNGFPTYQLDHVAYFKYGYLLFITKEHVPDAHDIFKRFAKVFEQTYTRFLDLQKAEAQAKEALIEAAIERVRSRSMAMHKSSELRDVVNTLHVELRSLNLNFHVAAIQLLLDDTKDLDLWIATDDGLYSDLIHWPHVDLRLLNEMNKARKSKTNIEILLSKSETTEFFDEYFKLDGTPQERKTALSSVELVDIIAFYQANTGIFLMRYSKGTYSDEEKNITHRFSKVFEQTYTRFLDLQKAEAQAREAQIEASLERVRASAMAMHKSDDLTNSVDTVFSELKQLGFNTIRCGIGIFNDQSNNVNVWTISSDSKEGKAYLSGDEKLEGHPLLEEIYAAWKNQVDLSYTLKGKDLENYYQLLATSNLPLSGPKGDELATQYYHGDIFPAGGLFAFSNTPFSDSKKQLMKRFAEVFHLSFTRHLDLKQAEAQAREAQIGVSLERVRSRTLEMQNSNELAETSVIVFKQLLELGIAPNRLFIGIVKEDKDTIEAWTTNEDGSKLTIHFSPQASKNRSIKKMLDGWKRKEKSIIIDMKGKELQDYFQYLSHEMKIPFIDGLKQKRRIQTIAYFSGGLIGMAAAEEQPYETIQLLERFASVFNLTYTRYNDLKLAEAQTHQAEQDLIKLQAAKKSAEDALKELQTTQTQLIQSEKMASLGELTAGIAHEIQNPLNFVNNFSEVSKELLDEMLEEMQNGDMEEVKSITGDVIQNLEKINHHGKRADGIVKGMLQHSRSSTGIKEPTNINALADEYLRLAYHGLRAKDKNFNATLETNFDENLENINIIPQDIGRVLLNLLTNAFYACTERSRGAVNERKLMDTKDLKNLGAYKPTVTLTTKNISILEGNTNGVSISIKDNGNGIPKKVLDKIFQPFFTTKPTGQGTGLGLSMSYDIVTKGHGGEIHVKTKQGEGSTFVVKIPSI